jgi:hypothetical protein
VTEKLHAALIAFYTGYFDKPKSLQMELDLSTARAKVDVKNNLQTQFKSLLKHRIEFCRLKQKQRISSLSPS